MIAGLNPAGYNLVLCQQNTRVSCSPTEGTKSGKPLRLDVSFVRNRYGGVPRESLVPCVWFVRLSYAFPTIFFGKYSL